MAPDGVEPRSAAPARPAAWLAAPLVAAAAVSVGLYIFGTEHTPDYYTSLFGRTAADTLPLKSWLGTGLLALAAVQVALALWMYGRLPGVQAVPGGVPTAHRLVGVAAFVLTLPIAYHCAFAYGVQTSVGARVAVHSIAGCFLYGSLRRQGDDRPLKAASGVDAPGGRRPAGHLGRDPLVHGLAVVLQRLPPPPALAPARSAT